MKGYHTAGVAMKGYYPSKEIHAAAKGLQGFVEVVCRGVRWELPYPPGNHAEIRVLTPQDFLFELVNFDAIDVGFKYTNLAGARMKVIYASDAPDYPMPRRW